MDATLALALVLAAHTVTLAGLAIAMCANRRWSNIPVLVGINAQSPFVYVAVTLPFNVHPAFIVLSIPLLVLSWCVSSWAVKRSHERMS